MAPGVTADLLDGPGTILVLVDDAIGEEGGGHLHGFVHQAAGIAAQIEDHARGTLVEGGLDGRS